MVPPQLPAYVVDAADWFRSKVADHGKSLQLSLRRPIHDLRERDGALLVHSGLVAITSVDGSGSRQTVGLRYPGELIVPFHTARAIVVEAVQESHLEVGSDDSLSAALAGDPEGHSLLRRVANRELAIASEWLARFGCDALGRLAHLICETFVRVGVGPDETLKLPFNQQQLGEITGQTNINVNRMLAELDRNALIDRDGRAILVHDWSELRQLGRFNPAYLD
jgi:CRP-like cAMP-binding protein